MCGILSAQDWARREFGSAELGDERLTRRTVRVAAAMAADPEASIPRQNKLWKATKGAYRLFDHRRSTYQAMIRPHWQQTRQAAGTCDGVVLMIRDTTDLDYTSHPATAGLGRFGKGPIWESGQGMLLHNVLAVVPPEGEPDPPEVLGLAWGKLWCRGPAEPDQELRRRRNKFKKPAGTESQRWIDAVEQIGPPPAAAGGVTWVHVGDREADIFDLYEQCTSAPGLGFLVRQTQPRNAVPGHEVAPEPVASKHRPGRSLAEVARSMPALARRTLRVAGKGNRAPREAKLRVAGGPVTVYSPWHDSRTARPLRLWAARVWEVDASEGVEPIEWILLTSLPVDDAADASRVASWYAPRWTVEEYHKCLKSGCKVQERQLESAERLRPLVGMLSVVAVRLLQLKHQARATPHQPAALRCVPRAQVHTLAAYLKKNVRPDVRVARLTVRQFVHEVAKLGGFVGRKGDGEPGWQTLWRGWHELELMAIGYDLATKSPRYG